jgi:hypothetical protein
MHPTRVSAAVMLNLVCAAGNAGRYAAIFDVAGISMSRFRKLAVCSFCFILFWADTSSAKEWRGIVPLRSSRADVARLYRQLTGASLFGIGLPQDSFNVVGEGMVIIQYSQGRCVEGWKIKRDAVVSITVNLTTPIPFEDMRAELEHLPKDVDDTGTLSYKNKKEGIYYDVEDGKVISISYGPHERDQKMTCKKAARV